MYIKSFSAKNWRVHKQVSVEFHPHSNLLCGGNSKGKTAILKGIMWCLGISTRIATEGDINHGADEAEATLEICLSRGSGVPEVHTIKRTLNRKGVATIRIDGTKVSVARALDILMLEWGLPHPEQLQGLLWLKQYQINALVYEDATSRQERCRALLGFLALKRFNTPLEKVIAGYNAGATNERSLGIDSRELATEIASVEKQIADLTQESNSYPTPEESRMLAAAVRGAIARLEYRAAADAATASVASLPPSLQAWYADAKAHLADPSKPAAPEILRLGDLALALNDLEQTRSAFTACESALAGKPNSERLTQHKVALAGTIARLELAEARERADAAIAKLPHLLDRWLEDTRASVNGSAALPPPSLDRIGDLVAAKQSLVTANRERDALLAADQVTAEVNALEHWLLVEAREAARRTTEQALAGLPGVPHVAQWAATMRQALEDTRHLPREQRIEANRNAGVVNANVLIERNSIDAAAAKKNARRAQLVAALDQALGADAPNAEVRSQLRQTLRLEAEVADLAGALDLSASACNGQGNRLRAIAGRLPRIALAKAIPATAVAGSEAGALTPKAEQALRVVWDELQRNPTQGKCPLTGDTFSATDITAARKAQADREALARASADWQAFQQKVRSADPALATMLDAGDSAKAIELVREAEQEFKDIVSAGIASERSTFWSDATQRSRFLELHEQLSGLHANVVRSASEWLISRAAALHVSAEEFLDNVRALEDRIQAHGPELEVKTVPFPAALEPAVSSAQDAILAEDHAALAVLAHERQHGTVAPLGTVPRTADEARLRISNLHTVTSRRQTLTGQATALANTVAALTDTVFRSTEQHARYADLVATLTGSQQPGDEWARQAMPAATATVTALTVLRTKQTAAESLPAWDSSLGQEPSARADANRLLQDLDRQITETARLERSMAMAKETLARLTASTARLRTTTLNGVAGAERFDCLIAALRATPTDAPTLAAAASSTLTAVRVAHEKETAAMQFPSWPGQYGTEPSSVPIAQAQLATLEREAADRAALTGKIAASEQSLRRMRETVSRMADRAVRVTNLEAIRDRFKAVQSFLDPTNGPRVLMSTSFLEIVSRANEVLEQIGHDVWLVGDEDFNLFTGASTNEGHLIPAQDEGGGKSYVCGIALAIALCEHYNANTQGAGINCLLVDEPLLGVEQPFVPSLFRALTTGRRANDQVIVVEHQATGEAYFDKIIRLG